MSIAEAEIAKAHGEISAAKGYARATVQKHAASVPEEVWEKRGHGHGKRIMQRVLGLKPPSSYFSWDWQYTENGLYLCEIEHDDGRGGRTQWGMTIPWDEFPAPPTMAEVDLLGMAI